MIRTAARAGDHGAGIEPAHLRADRRDCGGVALQLRPHRIRSAGGLL